MKLNLLVFNFEAKKHLTFAIDQSFRNAILFATIFIISFLIVFYKLKIFITLFALNLLYFSDFGSGAHCTFP